MMLSQSKIIKAPKPGAKASKEPKEMWKENGFSSLIMAAQDQDPRTLAKDVLPVLLSYPTPSAIYHQYLQVLPSRTHSHMQMSSFGG
ncbi:hypothetical protein DY000_02034777 [Brassica cretica]|uniref:tRNA (adenine(58)-N(1))-methyltransferase non-catalytic subunit TRM6 n=1 Tax=Brassica cretica TaxID=69181 RepID=A0ABQ7DLL8_BRACR|nr:hypothetical protein DY000_02034777 [Brassica cretica]